MNDVCDYCNGWIDDDGDTYPVYVDGQPTAKARATYTVPKLKEVAAYEGVKQRQIDDGSEMLGERIDFAKAIIAAIEGSDTFEITRHHAVTEQTNAGEGVFEMGKEDEVDMIELPSYETNRDKVRVDIVAETTSQSEPDMMVCKHCKDELKGGVND